MRWNIKLALTAVWAAVGTCGYLIVPESAPFLLPLSVLAPLVWYPRKGLAAHLWGRSVLARILAVASAFLLINATWSTAPSRTGSESSPHVYRTIDCWRTAVWSMTSWLRETTSRKLSRILVIFLQRFVIRGLTAGALKA